MKSTWSSLTSIALIGIHVWPNGTPRVTPGPCLPAERRRTEEGRHRQDSAGCEDGVVLPARGARVGLAAPHQPAAMRLLLRRAWRVRPRGDGAEPPGGRRGAGPQGGGAGGGGVAGCGAGPRTRGRNLPPDERWRCALWAVGVVVYFGGAVDETKYWRVVNSLTPSVQILPAP